MARVTKGILNGMAGHLDDVTVYERGGRTFLRPRHIRQPRSLSREQLAVRERQSHNNGLWRALLATGMVFFEGGKAPYYRFMSLNQYSPVAYLTKWQLQSGNALLLPDMVVSEGPLRRIGYRLGEVEGRPALLTDLAAPEAGSDRLLLYVLRQSVRERVPGKEEFRVGIEAEWVAEADLARVPQASDGEEAHDTLALVGERFADPMLGFALVRVRDGRASSQRVVTRCTYFEHYTTEEALMAAAKSYGGLTGI